MAISSSSVSIHPYFKGHPGKEAEIRELLGVFVEKTATEAGCLYYEFTINGDVVFCRESYVDAEAALLHLSNVGEELGAMLKLSDLARLELHGPAAELDKLRAPLAGLNPAWFVLECGLKS